MSTSGRGCCDGKRIEIIKVRTPGLGVNLQKLPPVPQYTVGGIREGHILNFDVAHASDSLHGYVVPSSPFNFPPQRGPSPSLALPSLPGTW